MAKHDLIAIFTKDKLPKKEEWVLIKSLRGFISETRYYWDPRRRENIFYEPSMGKQYGLNEIICWYRIDN